MAANMAAKLLFSVTSALFKLADPTTTDRALQRVQYIILRNYYYISSELEEALLLIPFNSACEIVRMLPGLLDRGDSSELLCRLAVFLLRVHHAALVANHGLLKNMIQIQAKASMRLNELRVCMLLSNKISQAIVRIVYVSNQSVRSVLCPQSLGKHKSQQVLK